METPPRVALYPSWTTGYSGRCVVIVRFADDLVVGFEHRDDAERFWTDLRGRLAKFALELNAEKTRLIEFGRFAASARQRRGVGKPETSQFLGFTHICAKTQKGRFKLKRITDSKRMRAKLRALKGEITRKPQRAADRRPQRRCGRLRDAVRRHGRTGRSGGRRAGRADSH